MEYEIPTASRARDMCEIAANRGQLTWLHIFLEELCEAVEAYTIHGENSPEGEEELIQTVAVGLSALECLKRKQRRAGGD